MTQKIRNFIEKIGNIIPGYKGYAIRDEKRNTDKKLRDELVEIEAKLDRLLDLQLDGNLSQAEYTTKKHKLILAKKDLEEKITAFGRKSNNRFELAIAFLKDANQAEKYAQQENPERIRDFLKKIGSNFRIADRTLVLDFKNAFKIAEKYHAEALCAEATSFNFAECKTWRSFLDEVRTFFEQNSE